MYNPPYGAPPGHQQAYPPPAGAPPPPPHGNAAYPPPQHSPYPPPTPHEQHQHQPYGYGAPPSGPPHQAYGIPAPPIQHQSQHQHQAYPQPHVHSHPTHPSYSNPSFFYFGIPIPPPPPHQPSQPPHGYNPQADVDRIRGATKGFGTDEKTLIQTLAPLDAFQIDSLGHQFKATVGKDLLTLLEKETSGWFEAALRAKVLGPVGYDVWLIHRACDGAGTHEDILNEVLLGRTNSEIYILKQAYRAKYNKDMEKVVDGELSMKTKRMFTMALQGVRMEDNVPVNHQMVEQDISTLISAFKGLGTDEIATCGVLLQRSTPHLQAVARAFEQKKRTKLSKAVDSEFSGHMRDALLFIVNGVEGDGNGIERDAALIEESMKGMGTKDERLVYRVMRAHWNRQRFEHVKQAYAAHQHKKGLKNRVEGETSGDYKRMISAIVGN